nr:hypothetical protein [uncultured Cetobacterium sp.]
MERKEFKKYAIEVVLTVLKMSSVQMDKLKDTGDLSGTEILQEKVITPYERIYGALLEMNVEKMDDEEFKSFQDMVEEIRTKNNVSKEQVETAMIKRVENKGRSGAKVVEKFYKYNLNRLLDNKEKVVEVFDKYSIEEQKLENLLKDTVQEQEQFDIIYELQPVREKIREIEQKYISLEKEINEVKTKLESKWPYEIYGVVSEEELLETYKETFKMEE